VFKNFAKISKSKQVDYYLPYYLVPKKVDPNRVTISCLTHFEPKDSFKTLGWQRALLNSDFLVAISNLTYETAINHGVPKNKIKLIRYGVDKKYKPYLLTAPSVNRELPYELRYKIEHNECMQGKNIWIEQLDNRNKIFFKSAKHKSDLAKPDRILSDDREDTIYNWIQNG
jgi:hypothetical protein